MKKLILLLFFLQIFRVEAQEKANRFFYEFSYKPSKTSSELEKTIMILDIKKDKSIYKDYQLIVNDSLANKAYNDMQKTGTFNPPKSKKSGTATYIISKTYPSMDIQYMDNMLNGLNPIVLGYEEKIDFNWQIKTDKKKIGAYTAQKALLNFGGRNWIAWFSDELPFNDGPYKFFGLPGLIISIEDADKNFSWNLAGNKAIMIDENDGNSFLNNLTSKNPKIVSKNLFFKTFDNYQQNPTASMKSELSPEILNSTMPGMNVKIGEFIDQQGDKLKSYFEKNNNPIEK
ncbi:GLPGLI family protein [Chryseobacterium sp. cx-311]|uniref:GLPGLI family protein n=1 Tax=Marnyiella aurantia TaxID=2758037 RepID=UPI001AE4F4BD|nr:GLPGLI family protein [Marnyiella aurantia]MBP0613905.1 GLPGLI family protein [Marnyiella aurantia]